MTVAQMRRSMSAREYVEQIAYDNWLSNERRKAESEAKRNAKKR